VTALERTLWCLLFTRFRIGRHYAAEIQSAVLILTDGAPPIEPVRNFRAKVINGEVDGVAFDELSVVDVLDAAVASVTGRAA
jgi:hypothetical protein